MEAWRKVFRDGVVPSLTTKHLQVLADALARDDVRLTHVTTTIPVPMSDTAKRSVAAACALGFCGWQGDGLQTVEEVANFFARVCSEIDQRLGEPAASRWLLNWWDDLPTSETHPQLLAEVNRALAQRHSCEQQPQPRTAGEREVLPSQVTV